MSHLPVELLRPGQRLRLVSCGSKLIRAAVILSYGSDVLLSFDKEAVALDQRISSLLSSEWDSTLIKVFQLRNQRDSSSFYIRP